MLVKLLVCVPLSLLAKRIYGKKRKGRIAYYQNIEKLWCSTLNNMKKLKSWMPLQTSMYFLMTNDVELTSLGKNREDPTMAETIYKSGLPRILDLFSKYDVESTFYFTGNLVEIKPETVEIVKAQGHEIGCHSYSHDPNLMLDLLPFEKQYQQLQKAKKIIEKVAGEIVSFRSPELRLNSHSILAMEKCGFITDSSVSSQRFDGPLSYGMKYKIYWMVSPRKPYFPSYNSPFARGNSKILEIPVSALIAPYIGTTMRISPAILRLIEKILFYEAKSGDKPIVFIFHPNEAVEYNEIQRSFRTTGVRGALGDSFRQDIKMRIVGVKAINLLEQVLKRAKKFGFEFISVKRYRKIYLNEVKSVM